MKYEETFYEEVLKNHLGDPSIKVLSINEDPDIARGENFLSDIVGVHVDLTRNTSSRDGGDRLVRETRSFVLKHEPVNNSRILKTVQERKLFTYELRILRDVLPRIEAALEIRLGPKLVYGTDSPPRTIMMEDLTPEGFYVKNRRQGLPIAHATMAIKNLAKFHAGSVALYEEDPKALMSFRQGVFGAKTSPSWFLLLSNSLNVLCKEAMTWSDEGCVLAAKKLRDGITSIIDRVRNAHNYEAHEFCVLNHGDVWINNMLFLEDTCGQPMKQVYVDYQMSSFSSPAIDLLFFLGVNLGLEYRGSVEEVLLEIYLDKLTACMVKLRCKTSPPTMENLKDAMRRRRVYAVMSGLFLLPRMSLDKKEILLMDELLQRGTPRINVYQKPNTIRMMKRILPLMHDGGYLDV